MMAIDTSAWSGDGSFTPRLLDALAGMADIESVRVEDAPASRTEAGYAFISNEVYVRFCTDVRGERTWWLGCIPRTRRVETRRMTLAGLEALLCAQDGIGAPDYADAGMLQYLRTERVVAPYQTKGIKVVELVRIYEAGASSPQP